MGRRTTANSGSVFLDELSLSAAWRLIWNRGPVRITVLEAIEPSRRFLVWVLRAKGLDVVEAEFFAGRLRTADGESVRRASRRESGQIALVAARKIVGGEPSLSALNDHYGRNTIALYIAKHLHLHVEYWTFRSRVAQALGAEERSMIWMKKPARFDEKLLAEYLPGVDYVFYPTIGIFWIHLVLEWMRDIARDIRLTRDCSLRARSDEPVAVDRPGVLALQEDQVRFGLELRGQPHWLDRAGPNGRFNTHILMIQGPRSCTSEEESLLSRLDVRLIPATALRLAARAMKCNVVLARARCDGRKAFWAARQANDYAQRFALLKVAFLLRQAEQMGALAISLNVRVFLNSEPYLHLADAMQLVAPSLNVKTVAYQYSNLGFQSPMMMSTADRFLVFSDMFKALYVSDGIAPKEFLSIGYPYDGVAALVRDKAGRHRAGLNGAGARFVVCYFDESVQHDRWGLVSKEDHLGELHVLAEKVLADSTFGVVVKSQFIFNSPSRLYPEDELIRTAKSTGRFLELQEGSHRNDIFPAEAALVSDLCIGHKFGATAALEAALAGVRSVLLDSYGSASWWDTVYAQADVEYETMESLMAEIGRYRSGEEDHQTLGDWSQILHHFDPYRDGCAMARLRSVVEQACESAAVPSQLKRPRPDATDHRLSGQEADHAGP
jgi:hypothetical protein